MIFIIQHQKEFSQRKLLTNCMKHDIWWNYDKCKEYNLVDTYMTITQNCNFCLYQSTNNNKM